MIRCALYVDLGWEGSEDRGEPLLGPLRERARWEGWQIGREYVDGLGARHERAMWRLLLEDAADRRFSVVLAPSAGHAFRSLTEMTDVLARWDDVGVRFLSVEDGFDSAAPLAKALRGVLAIARRLGPEAAAVGPSATCDVAMAQGKRKGRPRVIDRPGFKERLGDVHRDLSAGRVGLRAAVRRLGVSPATLTRLLRHMEQPTPEKLGW
jgi:DNA invertase Pin-like site-specific DNA recombinase